MVVSWWSLTPNGNVFSSRQLPDVGVHIVLVKALKTIVWTLECTSDHSWPIESGG